MGGEKLDDFITKAESAGGVNGNKSDSKTQGTCSEHTGCRIDFRGKEPRIAGIEFGAGIAERIICEFCDSDFINQENYVQTIIRLQEIFYLYKNEMQDEITDDELLHLMKEQFENLCFGDLDYLEGTCLSGFAQAIRAGYEGYKGSDGFGEYAVFDEVKRWDYDLYLETLKELCWR